MIAERILSDLEVAPTLCRWAFASNEPGVSWNTYFEGESTHLVYHYRTGLDGGGAGGTGLGFGVSPLTLRPGGGGGGGSGLVIGHLLFRQEKRN